jgi:hypothetical protein
MTVPKEVAEGRFGFPTPAWHDFYDDPVARANPVMRLVYAEVFSRGCRHLAEPLEVKGWVWARLLKIERKSLIRALNLLVERGYLHEHARAHARAPRRFTIGLVRNVSPAQAKSAKPRLARKRPTR